MTKPIKNYTIVFVKVCKFRKDVFMNQDFEKKEGSQDENKARKGGEPKRKSFSGLIIAALCAVIFVILYAIVNASSLSGAATSVVNVLNPVILGFGIAYLLNPILNFFERKAFKFVKNKKLLRALSLVST